MDTTQFSTEECVLPQHEINSIAFIGQMRTDLQDKYPDVFVYAENLNISDAEEYQQYIDRHIESLSDPKRTKTDEEVHTAISLLREVLKDIDDRAMVETPIVIRLKFDMLDLQQILLSEEARRFAIEQFKACEGLFDGETENASVSNDKIHTLDLYFTFR